MRPTRCGHVRTGYPCAINRTPASAGKPWSTGISGSARSALRSRSRCGTNTTPETQRCRCGCPERCCCERPHARRPPHYPRSHRAKPGPRCSWGPHTAARCRRSDHATRSRSIPIHCRQCREGQSRWQENGLPARSDRYPSGCHSRGNSPSPRRCDELRLPRGRPFSSAHAPHAPIRPRSADDSAAPCACQTTRRTPPRRTR